MAASGSQIELMREDGSEQPIEEIIESQPGLCDYHFDKDFHYENCGISSEATGSSRRT